MADDLAQSPAPPAVDGAAAPAIPSPETVVPALAPAAAAQTEPQPATVEAPAPTPVAEAKPAPEAAKGSLLGGEEGKEPAPPVEEPKPAEPIALPNYDKWAIPENVQLDAGQIGKFNELIGQFELDAGGDHAKVQQFGQKLVDFYIQEQQRAVQQWQDAWTATRETWVESIKSDKEIGGARLQTTLARADSMIKQFGGSHAQQTEFRKALADTGFGDHPAFGRFVNNIGKVLGEGKPVPATVPRAPVSLSRATKRYQAPTMNGAA